MSHNKEGQSQAKVLRTGGKKYLVRISHKLPNAALQLIIKYGYPDIFDPIAPI